MGPIKRRLKKSYSITSKELHIQSKRPWYTQFFLIVAMFIIGYSLAFWQFSRKSQEVDALKMSKQSLEVQIIKLERQLQIERVAEEKLQSKINETQEELLRTKEELVFYQNMVNKKKRK